MEREVLVIGDDRRFTYEFQDRMWHIKTQIVASQTSLEYLENINYRYIRNLHRDWITKVKYIPDLASIVTFLDTECKVIDLQSLDRIFDEYEQNMAEKRKRSTYD